MMVLYFSYSSKCVKKKKKKLFSMKSAISLMTDHIFVLLTEDAFHGYSTFKIGINFMTYS